MKLNAFLVAGISCAIFLFSTGKADALPAGFQNTVVWNGLDTPTAIAFAPNGKVFVAEKSGIIKVFDNLQDTTPTTFADLRPKVLDYGDRGLLGITIDPQFPTRPYVYVLYSVDALPGGTTPQYNDNCPNGDFCPAKSRLSKLTASGNVMTGEQILIENWCEIESSHSVGALAFGADGALYVSHGDGASYNYVDYGQDGGCPDPVNEGGALRSQDLRTSGDPVSYDGTVLRVHPDTGAGFAGNALNGGATTDDDPVIAYGFRNPFRFSIDNQTGRVWVADVGWTSVEEINSIPNPTAAVLNFGWPCYEGPNRQSGYDAANIPICETLYSAGGATSPYSSYTHFGAQNAISAIALYRGSNLPAAYNGALFFGDYAASFIRVMMPGGNGLPNPANIVDFLTGVFPVDLQIGPNGALYYVDIVEGSVHQVSYFAVNTPPTAHATANKNSGVLPLSVTFDGSTSLEPDAGDSLQYAWDLDGDGQFDDSTAVSPIFNYTQAQTVTVKLRVTDTHAGTSTDTLTIYAGNRAPTATITTPVAGTLFSVGEVISFSGSGNDPDTGNLSALSLKWEALLLHCALNNPSECHTHDIQSFNGVASGSFVTPDHEYPSRIEIRLTATDSTASGLTTTSSIVLQPRTTTWTFTSEPAGLQLAAYTVSEATPFTRTVIVGAQTTISAPAQELGAHSYSFANWSDGGAATHTITAGLSSQTFHAVFTQDVAPPPTCTLNPSASAVQPGANVVLSWATQNATALSINQGIGSIEDHISGRRTVNPTTTTTYIATVTGLGGNAQCSATVTVSTPAPSNNFPITILGGSFATKTTGGPTWNGDGGWIIWSNGSISQSINFPQSGPYKVVINALGELAGPDLPHMELRLDGVVIGAADLSNEEEYKPVSFNINVASAGSHQLAIAFTNDFYSANLGDRNVDIFNVTVGVVAQQPAVCGDGIKNGSEQCDGNDGVGAHQSCSAQCTLINLPYCGDGIKNGAEQCDGTSGVGAGQVCTAQCTLTAAPSFNFSILGGSMTTKTTGGPTWNGDGGWIIWSNGNISHTINFPQAGQYTVVVRALGELAGSALPHMELRLNGLVVGSADVANEANYAPFTFNINVAAAGNRQVAIAFTNDFYNANQGDRNLDIYNLTITNIPQPPPAVCGDGIKNGMEQCDGTSGVGPNQSCSVQCTLVNLPFCGDGIKNGSEECDGTDGVGAGQSCTSQCTIIIATPFCGDGVKNGTEDCDGTDGVGAGQMCTAQCTLTNAPVCGDGIKNGSEQCDGTDGIGPNQSCSAQCTLINLPYCGDGIKNGSEQCDGTDGVGANQSCSAECALVNLPFCGDGIKNGSEQCDGTDGISGGQTCSGQCTIIIPPVCGDGIKNGSEQCDGTSGVGPNQSCSAQCALINLPYCGDGIKNGTEQCDGTDGVGAGQSCSAQCTLVTGYNFFILAKDMQTKSTGILEADGSWNLQQNGSIAHTINFPQAGAYTVTITARGDLAGSALPKMDVRLNSVVQTSVNVDSASYKTYVMTVNIPAAGNRTVGIGFTNDFYNAAQGDRNLIIKDMMITKPNVVAPPFTYAVNAVDMSVKTTGGVISGGWNLWSNGYLGQSVTFPQTATYKVKVTAKGELAGPAQPIMEIRLDGVAKATVNVGATAWTAYEVSFSIPSGSHQIAVAFTNDYYVSGADRNLHVQKVEISQ